MNSYCVGKVDSMEKRLTGYKVSGNQDFVSLNIRKDKMNSDISFGRKILTVLEDNDVKPAYMSVGVDTMTVYTTQKEFQNKEKEILAELESYDLDEVYKEQDISLINVQRTNNKARRGDIAKIFVALSQAEVEPKMINQVGNTPDIVIGVPNKDYAKTVKEIYHIFEIM